MSVDVDLSRFIRRGDRIMWGQAHAEPLTLIRRLVEQRRELAGARIFLGIGLSGQLTSEHAVNFELTAYGGSGTNRSLVESGVLDILPVHYSRLPELIRTRRLQIDVLMLQVPPPDPDGLYSLGMAREYLVEALATARVIIGEVQPGLPWTFGGPYLRHEDFGLLVDSDSAMPPELPARMAATDEAIGRHVASLVEDGSTLQTGIGSVPDAALAQLHGHRDLGVHTGSFGERLARLQQAGVVTNSSKGIDPGISIGGILMGGEALRRFAHMNAALELRGTSYTHDPSVLGRIGKFVAINSALEVDLTGQVNSEAIDGRYLGAVGGVNDFVRAARNSEGGVPIIALPSTSRTRSRIVVRLSGPVTLTRSDSCVIVTEHGIADLRGLTISQRIRSMMAIAHPEHRELLEREARTASS